MIKNITLLLFISLVFTCANAFSQKAYDIEGRYIIGKTHCTIEWSESDRVFRVYWDNGTGYTTIFYSDEYPNGNLVFTEYESDGSTYTGTFTFEDSTCSSGVYERADGKKFKIKKQS